MKDRVAMVLAVCVLIFFIGGILFIPFLHYLGWDASPNPSISELWAEVVNFLVGGLIGYAAGRGPNE